MASYIRRQDSRTIPFDTWAKHMPSNAVGVWTATGNNEDANLLCIANRGEYTLFDTQSGQRTAGPTHLAGILSAFPHLHPYYGEAYDF